MLRDTTSPGSTPTLDLSSSFHDTVTRMQVVDRHGVSQTVDLNRIVDVIASCCEGLPGADPMRIVAKTVSGLHDGVSTRALNLLSIDVAHGLTAEDPDYSRVAARLLARMVRRDVEGQGIHSFSQGIAAAFKLGLVDKSVRSFVRKHRDVLDNAIDLLGDLRFDYIGAKTVEHRYVLRHPETRLPLETFQHWMMRVAVGTASTPEEAIEVYRMYNSFRYLSATPTLLNSGKTASQLSSCFVLDSPSDDLAGIYGSYTDIAFLSKWSGGIGISYSGVRSRGSYIRGTNGFSDGIVPWLRTLDSSVAAVNQGGIRKGACTVTLEPWHGDIEAFLELRDNTGDAALRTHNLNLAVWVPDLFMERVEANAQWSLFSPSDTPELPNLWGENFKVAYEAYEAAGKARKTVSARALYQRMLRTLSTTGNGFICFKDRANSTSNQTLKPENVIHSSNLCQEILEINKTKEEASVCNLASINLAAHVSNGRFDFDQLVETAEVAVRQLDRVIDRNFYTIKETKASNSRWRPVGLGIMGLQDVFFALKMPFDSEAAKALSTQISECLYYTALRVSCTLAQEEEPCAAFKETRLSQGVFSFEHWGIAPPVAPTDSKLSYDWEKLRSDIMTHGTRNSLLLAIAPTATIASIAGVYECIEPQTSNEFKRETMSGDFMQINTALVRDLKARGLWTAEVRAELRKTEGSLQTCNVPEDLKALYRTVWEIPQRNLIDMAAARTPFIDQSTSLNLFIENPTMGKLSGMYMHAWKSGIKTTYYLRTRAATRTQKTVKGGAQPTAAPEAPKQPEKVYSDDEALVCSIDNPKACDACQ